MRGSKAPLQVYISWHFFTLHFSFGSMWIHLSLPLQFFLLCLSLYYHLSSCLVTWIFYWSKTQEKEASSFPLLLGCQVSFRIAVRFLPEDRISNTLLWCRTSAEQLLGIYNDENRLPRHISYKISFDRRNSRLWKEFSKRWSNARLGNEELWWNSRSAWHSTV